ncbi:TIGR02530 family flagellar biosynthesis protein [Alkaliphilus oremlandii]|uniref:Flagellar operon protein n=1 Tax=Alkaliphilus oremlandii (strain OhILAs) TaxID=350688 RepID=A8MHE4_ALKOO|nr:TIGR02530 family flagellar biosynthesis protein [Alkaliphilus oremlandii]ABW19031.1 flagellar operon protein [Alkaliphilus oremlandii OhILAs]
MYPIKMNPIRVNQNHNQNQRKNINPVNSQNLDFKALLHNEINRSQEVKFSKHALDRLQERNIELTTQEVTKINNAITKAASKGIKETLIIMENKAFIASVPNRTVITAATDQQLKDNVFTNIDGAIFA